MAFFYHPFRSPNIDHRNRPPSFSDSVICTIFFHRRHRKRERPSDASARVSNNFFLRTGGRGFGTSVLSLPPPSSFPRSRTFLPFFGGFQFVLPKKVFFPFPLLFSAVAFFTLQSFFLSHLPWDRTCPYRRSSKSLPPRKKKLLFSRRSVK